MSAEVSVGAVVRSGVLRVLSVLEVSGCVSGLVERVRGGGEGAGG